ncbi:MAG TPA: hypothetical protein VH374_26480 [Polyangia bacterium]|jgi:hypothetical protein|nr:hypothetical protein [Polyangia bacterium]
MKSRQTSRLLPVGRLRFGLLGLVVCGLLTAAGCGRAQQTIGALAPAGVDAADDTPASTIDSGSPGTPDAAVDIGGGDHVSPTLVPEWNCGPTCYRAPEVPALPRPETRFGGPIDTNAADKPTIVYPFAGALYPVNLADLTVQWRRAPGGAQHLFRIRVTAPPGNGLVHFDFLVPCGQPPDSMVPEECIYALPPGAWLETVGKNRGQQMDVSIAAVDSTVGKNLQVATSDSLRLDVSPDSLEGGLYFWSSKISGMYRLLFGARHAQAFVSPRTAVDPTICAGCHSVSLNGNVLAFTAGNDPEGSLVVTKGSDPGAAFFAMSSTPNSSTVAVNPDGTRVLVLSQGQLVLHDTSDGNVLLTVDPALLGTDRVGYFPEWAPDGKEVVVTLATKTDNDYTVHDGSIAMLPYDAGAFGAARIVAEESTTDFNYYPTWSPDGKWIAFATAHVGPGQVSYTQPGSRLRLVARDGGRIYELAKATHLQDHGSTWPKFAPFSQSNNNIFFITFNSKIDYGFILKNSASLPDGVKLPQLWLTAIDLRDLSTGDPSRPPLWLPFQDVEQSNHLASWTERLGCPTTGETTGCAEDEVCDKDQYCVRP